MTASAAEGFDRVESLRSKGDSLARRHRLDEARSCWIDALAIVDAWLADPHATEQYSHRDRANQFGISGGLARRLGDTDRALDRYREGARIEGVLDLPETYNRTNAIKLALITQERPAGRGEPGHPPPRLTLADLHGDLVDLRDALQIRLTDERVADDAWAWADLGDVRLLLGEDAAAAQAYRTFRDKGRSSSVESMLKVIKDVAAALVANNDPAAGRVARSVAAAEQVLGTA